MARVDYPRCYNTPGGYVKGFRVPSSFVVSTAGNIPTYIAYAHREITLAATLVSAREVRTLPETWKRFNPPNPRHLFRLSRISTPPTPFPHSMSLSLSHSVHFSHRKLMCEQDTYHDLYVYPLVKLEQLALPQGKLERACNNSVPVSPFHSDEFAYMWDALFAFRYESYHALLPSRVPFVLSFSSFTLLLYPVQRGLMNVVEFILLYFQNWRAYDSWHYSMYIRRRMEL